MTDVHNLTILADGLNLAEAEKLERLQARLADLFVQAGYPDVRICEATGEGEQRKLTFLREPARSSVITITSIAFLASTTPELFQLIEGHLVTTRPA